ncbi:ketosynthase chain-length factor [Thermostaphylospora chromogena]|uniref:Act minimal PKS chain-length factor (CLF/KS beta) n=1 Tax=Thermostaphylospora chromogena TaxID=35622 RepID=A0A1H1A841_9ACTN|nr:ketosynthase chain-length factor [Thermostaphylospora chromogena]SDQ35804.1 act minimal PKS chain-length factor (CLF/KS beta) [Thermostaphylospora chromogena]
MTAVVTGIGVIAPNGIGTEAYWSAVLGGRSGIGRITRFDPSGYPVRLAGEIRGFTAAEHIPGRLIVETDRWTHLGLAAADMALTDAGADPAAFPEYEMAVTTSSSSGGTEFGQREIERLWRDGPRHVGAYQSIAWFYAATTGQISIRHKMRGPCGVIATEQAGGIDVLAQARRLVRDGARLVVTGGTDASLCPYGLTAQLATGMLSTGRYLPFDTAACGYLPGEGGAILIVEDGSRPAARPYGEIAGYAATFDPPPRSGRPPALRRAIEGALADAAMSPADIDVVFADAMAVPELDEREATAIAEVFGPFGVPVTAPKTMTGRLYGGGAALDVATALLALRHQIIPPTVGVRDVPARYAIDLVSDLPRPSRLRGAMVIARGHGGFNSVLIVTSPQGERDDGTHSRRAAEADARGRRRR